MDRTVLFDYQKGRNREAPQKILEGFKRYLQTVGYEVDPYGKKEGMTHHSCWAHARKKIFEAQQNDREREELELVFIWILYEIEAHCRENRLTPQERKAYGLEKALPLLDAFSKWLTETMAKCFKKVSSVWPLPIP